MGKVTWQTTPAACALVRCYNRNLKDRFHRRDSPVPVRRGPRLDAAGPAGAELRRPAQPGGRQRGWCRRALRPHVGHFPTRYQAEVQPTDIAMRDVSPLHAHRRRRDQQSLNPNHRYQGNADCSLFVDRGRGGTPRLQGRRAVVVGAHGSTSASATATYCSRLATACRSRRRCPTRRSTPTTGWRPGARSCRTAGSSAALTVNAGVRVDGVEGLPAGADEPGRLVRRRAQLPRRPTSSTSR